MPIARPCHNHLLSWRSHVAARRLSSSFTRPPAETVTVPVQSNGSVNIDIHLPPTRPSALILSLPSSRPSESTQPDASSLSHSANAIVALIQYRLPPTFPTPIHDTLAAYDWIVENIARPDRLTRIGVHGSFVGGSLALALGMTESRLEDDFRIAAVAADRPICTWVLEETTLPPKLGQTPLVSDVETLQDLKSLRSRFFDERKPGSYFDPFASPMHFLRSPGAAVPVPSPRLNATSVVGLDDKWATLDALEAAELQKPSSIDFSEVVSDGNTTVIDPSQVVTRRPSKRIRSFPPAGTNLVLPQLIVRTTGNDLIDRNAEEFVRLLRRIMIAGKFEGMNQTSIERVLRGKVDDDELVDAVRKAQGEVCSWIQSRRVTAESLNDGKFLGKWFLDALR